MGQQKKIKCVIWDLDNTIWDGILLEDKSVRLKEEIKSCIEILDQRGILQSITSKNQYDDAMEKLDEIGITQYFIYPKINWGNKSESIRQIIQEINISADTVAFIDDQQFELDEVKGVHEDILCILPQDIETMLDNERFIPNHITKDSKLRRAMYQADIKRNQAEHIYEGTRENFLSILDMKVTVNFAEDDDLDRVIELTERTSQLNTTGYTYSYDELLELQRSKEHYLLTVELDDKYGSSGKVGLVLISKRKGEWIIELLIMSCRVISRGIGSIIIDYILHKAKENNVRLYAKFISTDRNKMMYMSYSMAGFILKESEENTMILENKLNKIRTIPAYVNLIDKATF